MFVCFYLRNVVKFSGFISQNFILLLNNCSKSPTGTRPCWFFQLQVVAALKNGVPIGYCGMQWQLYTSSKDQNIISCFSGTLSVEGYFNISDGQPNPELPSSQKNGCCCIPQDLLQPPRSPLPLGKSPASAVGLKSLLATLLAKNRAAPCQSKAGNWIRW